MKWIACDGSSAARMPGSRAIWWAPSAPSATNQARHTGPKKAPTDAVPWRWIQNSPIRMASEIGTMNGCSSGDSTSRPSTAPSTDTAGVIIPSP